MTLLADSHQLTPGALVDLFELDLNPIGINSVFRFAPMVDSDLTPIHFNGNDYQPLPVKMTGIQKNGSGAAPRPHLSLSNIGGAFTAYLAVYDDLVGAKISRILTLGKYLNTETVSELNYRVDSYFIEQKTAESPEYIEFELASAFDFTSEQVPSRICFANTCTATYKSFSGRSVCRWLGTDPTKWYDKNDVQVFTQAEDDCSKTLNGCKLRFYAAGFAMDFNGAPGVGKI